jgi:glucose-6-phosphate 1-dehydrogenase
VLLLRSGCPVRLLTLLFSAGRPPSSSLPQPEVFVQAATVVRKRLVHETDSTSSGPKQRRWARLVLEKPFGSDRASSSAMQRDLEPLFREPDLYRIDHYLGKELVENILVLRLANQVFSPLWCARPRRVGDWG